MPKDRASVAEPTTSIFFKLIFIGPLFHVRSSNARGPGSIPGARGTGFSVCSRSMLPAASKMRVKD